jgi:glycosyltransferase involved in cell wall biosynthesis
MIGIVTRYRKTDATLSALALAHHLESLARSYSLFVYDWRAGSIDSSIDNKIHRYSFRDWLQHVNHIIWTSPVDTYFIHQAKQHGIRSTLWTSWEQLEPYDEKVIGEYAHILVPSLVQAMQLRERFKLKNTAVLPYVPTLPDTDCSRYSGSRYSNDSERASRCAGRTRLFLSLYGAQLRRVDLSSILILAEVVKQNPEVEVTIACSKGLAIYTTKELKQLAKKYTDRWTNLWDCSWKDQSILMGEHDLTVWPAKVDGFGIVGLTSLTVGTPVIAWDVTPINEYIAAGRNGLLVSCDVEYNWLGVPQVKPNYDEFGRILNWLITQPNALKDLRAHTLERAEARREEFTKGWEAVLPMAI